MPMSARASIKTVSSGMSAVPVPGFNVTLHDFIIRYHSASPSRSFATYTLVSDAGWRHRATSSSITAGSRSGVMPRPFGLQMSAGTLARAAPYPASEVRRATVRQNLRQQLHATLHSTPLHLVRSLKPVHVKKRRGHAPADYHVCPNSLRKPSNMPTAATADSPKASTPISLARCCEQQAPPMAILTFSRNPAAVSISHISFKL